ncbi:hypothetical protein [Streptomyces sp. NPDC058304]|uniref:hypothetical protein n=1 Tax=Streptomyces sp. NPDC058304 TaxID=3346437 RepID=UPI0036EA1F42
MMIMKRSAVAAAVFALTLSLPTAAHAAAQPATLAPAAAAVPQVTHQVLDGVPIGKGLLKYLSTSLPILSPLDRGVERV